MHGRMTLRRALSAFIGCCRLPTERNMGEAEDPVKLGPFRLVCRQVVAGPYNHGQPGYLGCADLARIALAPCLFPPRVEQALVAQPFLGQDSNGRRGASIAPRSSRSRLTRAPIAIPILWRSAISISKCPRRASIPQLPRLVMNSSSDATSRMGTSRTSLRDSAIDRNARSFILPPSDRRRCVSTRRQGGRDRHLV